MMVQARLMLEQPGEGKMTEPGELVVRSIMMPSPVAVSSATPVTEAVRLMGDRNIGAVVVTTDGRVDGVFTERDVLRRAMGRRDDWSRTPVSEVMTSNPVTISPDVSW